MTPCESYPRRLAPIRLCETIRASRFPTPTFSKSAPANVVSAAALMTGTNAPSIATSGQARIINIINAPRADQHPEARTRGRLSANGETTAPSRISTDDLAQVNSPGGIPLAPDAPLTRTLPVETAHQMTCESAPANRRYLFTSDTATGPENST